MALSALFRVASAGSMTRVDGAAEPLEPGAASAAAAGASTASPFPSSINWTMFVSFAETPATASAASPLGSPPTNDSKAVTERVTATLARHVAEVRRAGFSFWEDCLLCLDGRRLPVRMQMFGDSTMSQAAAGSVTAAAGAGFLLSVALHQPATQLQDETNHHHVNDLELLTESIKDYSIIMLDREGQHELCEGRSMAYLPSR